ncbi:MAG TPA: extracellular solute-binding protein [Candidatus Lachnoclostridium stercorigallinarum]|uniref:Extracellular solute-binding protein n=1 Tax=Candidatus Lachnoclostridium stercorigallinarum TaxID=2838634 RepID=A0A9D2K607_9FIRM|nr:extracellular solute-binding protein [Candidatus Lachnoclostridium stercorigallinarum]
MATIKDIAKYAGVSHGTVSNVLNRKGNVSAEKIKLVEQAAKALGYQINSQASKLRSGKSENICIIVPRMDLKMYGKLYAGIEKELHEQDYTIEILCSEGMASTESRLLKKALSLRPTAIVLVSCRFKNEEPVPEETTVIMVDRFVKGFPENSVFLSFDYEKAGREIAEKCVQDGNKSIALLCENERYSSDRSFIKSVSEVLENEGCYFEVLEAPEPMKFNRAFDLLYAADPFDAIIAMSREDVENIEMAHSYNSQVELPRIYSLVSRTFGLENSDMYELDYKLMGQHIAKIILRKEEFLKRAREGKIKRGKSGVAEVTEEGRFPQRKISAPGREETIRFLTVNNSTGQAIKRLLPLFKEQTGIEVNMVETPYDELRKMVSKMKVTGETVFDMVRIDMAWMLGDSEKIFRKMNEDDPVIRRIRSAVFPGIPEEYYSVNGAMYALPLDACVQMLFCRKDIFEDELIKRGYYENTRRKLSIPGSFQEYNQVAAFFTRRYNKKSPTGYGTTLTCGRSYTAACEVLPRFYELGGCIPDRNGRVQVLSEKMKAAVESCMESEQYATKEPHFWWQEAAEVFSDGFTAMNILFSNYASDMVRNVSSKVAGKIIYAEVPGGNPLLGGGSVGITKSTEKEEACLKFLDWLYSDEISEMVTYLGGFIGNRNIVKNADILELYPWIEGIEEMFRKGKRGSQKKKNQWFDEFAFEDILGSAVISAMSGTSTVDEALGEAQRICDRLFNREEQAGEAGRQG